MEQVLIELEIFFSSIQLSQEPIRLDNVTILESPDKMVKGHIEQVRARLNSKTAEPYLARLIRLKNLLTA